MSDKQDKLRILLFDIENLMKPQHIFNSGKPSRFASRPAGFCVTPDHKLLKEDLTWVEAGSIKVGDVVLGFDEEVSNNRNRKYRKAVVTRSTQVDAEVFKVTLSSGKVFKVTADHKWLVGFGQQTKWVTTDNLVVRSEKKEGSKTSKLLDMWEADLSYDAGWLAGFLDGEGHLRQAPGNTPLRISASQNPGDTADRFLEISNRFVQTSVRRHRKERECLSFELGTSKQDRLKFLGSVRPSRLLNKFDFDKFGSITSSSGRHDEVIAIEPLGVQKVAEITTTTGTFICDGYPMHNCADLAYILVFGYKWLGSKKAEYIIANKKDFKESPTSDETILYKIYDIMNEADVVVTWYGSVHDFRFVTARLAQKGMYLDQRIKHIDLHKTAKTVLPLSSNRLNKVAEFFGKELKTDISPEVWARTWGGDYEALKEMAEYCITPDHKLLKDDLRWYEARDLKVGDVVLGFDEHGNRKYRKAVIEKIKYSPAEVFEVVLESGKVFKVTKEHQWLVRKGNSFGWTTTDKLYTEQNHPGKASVVSKFMNVWEEDTSKEAGWLAGMFDGEGTYSTGKRHGRLSIGQNPGPILDKIQAETDKYSVTSVRITNQNRKCRTVDVRGSVGERLEFLGRVRPERLISKVDFDRLGRLEGRLGNEKIISVRSIGVQEIIKIQTSTGTFICDGYAMHNCAQDVEVLEQVYQALKPLEQNIPHVRKYVSPDGVISCPMCESANIHSKGRRVTKVYTIRRLHCQECGGWFDGEKTKRV